MRGGKDEARQKVGGSGLETSGLGARPGAQEGGGPLVNPPSGPEDLRGGGRGNLWCAVIEVLYSRRARLAVVDADLADVFRCRWNKPFGVFSVGHGSQLMC